MKISATDFRQNLYQIIDRVIETGESVEITRRRGSVRIVAETKRSIWDRLEVHVVAWLYAGERKRFPARTIAALDHGRLVYSPIVGLELTVRSQDSFRR